MLRAARLLTVAAAALGASPVGARSETYRTYANERFGTSVEYPADFSRPSPPPTNGDGRTFRTDDGRASLTVFGHLNTDGETPRQLMAGRRSAGTAYSYAAATKDSFTLSGTRAGRISYLRCRLSPRAKDVVGCFELEYPAEEARRWDAAVVRMARSLRFGPSWYD